MSWWTYIVRTSRGHLYTGVTTDVRRRVYEHNHDRARASKKCWAERPVELVWSRQEKGKSEAHKAEARIKKLSRAKKEELIDAGRSREHSRRDGDHRAQERRGRGAEASAGEGAGPAAVLDQRVPSGPASGRQEGAGVAVRDPGGIAQRGAGGQHPSAAGGEEGEVIPSIEELIKCVKADPITSNCTEEILERHRRVGALEIRKLLMRFGVKEGWRRAKMLFSRPVQCMTTLDRDLTDEEMEALKESLGFEFDRKGYLVQGHGTVPRIGEGDAKGEGS